MNFAERGLVKRTFCPSTDLTFFYDLEVQRGSIVLFKIIHVCVHPFLSSSDHSSNTSPEGVEGV